MLTISVPGKSLPAKFCKMEWKRKGKVTIPAPEGAESVWLWITGVGDKGYLCHHGSVRFMPKAMCILSKALDVLKTSEKAEYVQLPLFWWAS